MKEYEQYIHINEFSSWQAAWISVNGNPDIYILWVYDGNYYLLAYSYDKVSERGNFSCYNIDLDENGCYVQIGMKPCKMTSEELHYGLYITGREAMSGK